MNVSSAAKRTIFGDELLRGRLRDELLITILRSVNEGELTVFDAALAVHSALAVALAVVPAQNRETVLEELITSLPEHVARRAIEIENGAFDDAFVRARQ